MTNIIAAPCLCADVFVSSGVVRPGGEALNFAASVCRYEHVHVGLISVIGDDLYGQHIIKEIDKRPIDRSCVHILQGGVTAFNRIYLTEKGDRYFKPDSWNGGIFETFSLNEDDIEKLRHADIVHINHASVIFPEIVRLKKQLGYKISADFNVENRFDFLEQLAPDIDFFFISAAGREDEICTKLSAWSQHSDGIYVATFAENGSAAFHRGQEYRVNAKPVSEVIDTTGCGDSYQAGFIGEFTRSGNIIKSMNEGSAVAAQTLSHIGGLN